MICPMMPRASWLDFFNETQRSVWVPAARRKSRNTRSSLGMLIGIGKHPYTPLWCCTLIIINRLIAKKIQPPFKPSVVISLSPTLLHPFSDFFYRNQSSMLPTLIKSSQQSKHKTRTSTILRCPKPSRNNLEGSPTIPETNILAKASAILAS